MENKYKIGIVILNYNNYNETFHCVKSLEKLNIREYHLVIVDNGSSNNSYQILTKEYSLDKRITVISSGYNRGFAQGNNCGIKYLRTHFAVDFVLLLNSDTIVVDPLYVDKLVSSYHDDVGVIEANVWDRKGLFAQPSYYIPSFKSALYMFLKAFLEYIHVKVPFVYTDRKHKAYLCQVGCAIMLTPSYFLTYDGLYSKTFLYGEEHILLHMLAKAGLRLSFVDDTYLIHNEGGSTDYEILEGTRKKEKKVIIGYWNVLVASMHGLKALVKAAK